MNKRIIKQVLFLLVYTGAQTSYADILGYTFDGTTPVANQQAQQNPGLAGRVALAYDVDTHLSAEFGFTQLPTSKTLQTTTNIKTTNYVVDLLAKLTTPLGDGGLDVYTKAGFSSLSAPADQSLSASNGINLNTALDHIGPAYGVGASYEIMKNITANLDWLHFSDSDAVTQYQPNTDVILLSIKYRIPTSTW